ncbi:Sialin, partial [Araneus ventricosus]
MSPEQQVDLEMQFLRSGSLPCQLPKRFIVTILGFFGMFNVYAMRMNMSVAIVAMVNISSSLPENNTLLYAECPAEGRREEEITESESKAARYNWDSVTQSQIISSFFYGYFITVIIGGYLAERFGAHKIFGAGIFMTSVLSLLTPITVQWGLVPLITLRALEGLCE